MPDASWATILPSSQPSPGEVAQHGMDMREHQFERMAAMQEQHQRQRQIDQRYQEGQTEKNMSTLQSLPKQLNSSNLDLKGVNNKFLADHMAELTDKAKNMSHSQLQEEVNKLQPYMQWADKTNSEYEDANKGLEEWLRVHKNVDPSDAKNMLNHLFQQDHFKDDGTGNLTYNLDARPSDYVAKLQDPEVLRHMRVDYTPVMKFAKDIPSQHISGKQVVDHQGRVHAVSYNGIKSAFSTDPYRDADGKLKIDLQSNTVNGMKQATPEFMEMAQSDPEVKLALDHAFANTKARLQEKGVHIDPRNEGDLYKSFAYKTFNPLMSHDVNESVTEKTPRIRVSVNAGKNSAPPTINDVYSGMSSAVDGANGKMNVSDLPADQQEVALKYARMFSGDNTLSNKNVVVKKDENGELHLTKVKGDKSEEHLGKLDYSINSKANGRDKKTREAINKTITEKRGASAAPKTAKNPTGFVPHKM